MPIIREIFKTEITQNDCIVYALYMTFYVVFIYFYCEHTPTAFPPLNGLMFPHNKKKPVATNAMHFTLQEFQQLGLWGEPSLYQQ